MTLTPAELYWDLADLEEDRRRRAAILRAIYVLADGSGWDAQRMDTQERAALPRTFPLLVGSGV